MTENNKVSAKRFDEHLRKVACPQCRARLFDINPDNWDYKARRSQNGSLHSRGNLQREQVQRDVRSSKGNPVLWSILISGRRADRHRDGLCEAHHSGVARHAEEGGYSCRCKISPCKWKWQLLHFLQQLPWARSMLFQAHTYKQCVQTG